MYILVLIKSGQLHIFCIWKLNKASAMGQTKYTVKWFIFAFSHPQKYINKSNIYLRGFYH